MNNPRPVPPDISTFQRDPVQQAPVPAPAPVPQAPHPPPLQHQQPSAPRPIQPSPVAQVAAAVERGERKRAAKKAAKRPPAKKVAVKVKRKPVKTKAAPRKRKAAVPPAPKAPRRKAKVVASTRRATPLPKLDLVTAAALVQGMEKDDMPHVLKIITQLQSMTRFMRARILKAVNTYFKAGE